MRSLIFLLIISLSFAACKSPVKQSTDSIYSRHLQRHVPLTIITTPMPKNKEEMNLLIITPTLFLDDVRAKKIIDSLYKLKQIQPITVIAFDGKMSLSHDKEVNEYGLEEITSAQGLHSKKLNDFVADELYPFAKKKTGIRKFNSVAVCGTNEAAIAAFDIGWNHDEKIQKVGMFNPSFAVPGTRDDSTIIETIRASRKRPVLQVWMAGYGGFPQEEKFKEIIAAKKSISDFQVMDMKGSTGEMVVPVNRFADFLLWAFAK